MAAAAGAVTPGELVSESVKYHFREGCKGISVSEGGSLFEKTEDGWESIRLGDALDLSAALDRKDQQVQLEIEVVKLEESTDKVKVDLGISTQGTFDTAGQLLERAVPALCNRGETGSWYCNSVRGTGVAKFSVGNTVSLRIGKGAVTLFIDDFHISTVPDEWVDMLRSVEKDLFFGISLGGKGTGVRITQCQV